LPVEVASGGAVASPVVDGVKAHHSSMARITSPTIHTHFGIPLRRDALPVVVPAVAPVDAPVDAVVDRIVPSSGVV
jgi:hypothetical protein